MRLLSERFRPRRGAPRGPAGPPPIEEPVAAPDELAPRLWALLAAHRPRPLSVKERCRQSGLLFRGAPLLVRGVATALEEAPDLFADAAGRAARLRGAERRAAFWRALHLHLLRMARLAGDSYLREQGAAVTEAMAVIEEARHDARDPALPWDERLPGGLASRRQLALHDALVVLRARERQKRKARKARRRRERASASVRPE